MISLHAFTRHGRLREAFVRHAASLGWEDVSRFDGEIQLARGRYVLAHGWGGDIMLMWPGGSQPVASLEEATAVVERRRGEGLLDRLWREHVEREAG